MQRILILTLLLAALPVAAELEGQIPPEQGPLPDEVEARLIELANAATTLRMSGNARIPAGSRMEGDVVVLGGNADVGGTIEGELAVVNGDLRLEPGARVTGPLWVVGGRIEGAEEAELEGEIQVWQAPLRYRTRDGRVEGVGAGGEPTSRFLATDLGFGRTYFSVHADGAYNRVEGLPVRFGPVVETRGRNPLVLEAFAIWRSASGLHLDTEELGYHFTLDQGLGGRGTMSLGVEAYSRVRPVETRGLTDHEAALATFFLSRDYRDHFEAQGWSGYFDLRPVRRPLRLRLAYREEEHEFAPVGAPWTLGRGDDPWRPQPRIAEGAARYLAAEVEWDTRDDPDHPSDGVWLRARGLRQVGGTLRVPDTEAQGSAPAPPPGPEYPSVTTASLDLRRYARVSASSRLQVRLHVAGSLREAPLPPQFQMAPGGEGSLPGHPPFSLACGARDRLVRAPGSEPGTDALEGYGCDRVALAQIEFQRLLPFVWDPLPDDLEGSEWAGLIQVQPALSAFVNAGEGQALNADGLPLRSDSPARADIGAGIVTGALGLYVAHPLNRKERGFNFFLRLDHRF